MGILSAEHLAQMAATVAQTFDQTVAVWRGGYDVLTGSTGARERVETAVSCRIVPDKTSEVPSGGEPVGDPYVVRCALDANVRRNDQLRDPQDRRYVVARVVRYPASTLLRCQEDINDVA